MDKVAAYCEQQFDRHLDELKQLVRIPSVSFPGFDPNEVKRSAAAVADLLKRSGFQNVEIMEMPGVNPYVYGDVISSPDKPTVLLYAHHDVQPPGRQEVWQTDPFEPTQKAGPGGERLFGRGAADDKAGIIVHTAAVSAFLEAHGELPVNVKVVIEGEEEIGSGHLEQFLETYRKRLDADVMVLTDTLNYDCGQPAVTVALRGMVAMDVEVRALSKTLHSGMWGGPLPDPAMALCKMLATLTDDKGRIAVPGIRDQLTPVSEREVAEIKKLPYDEATFREQCGLLPSAELLTEGPSPVAQTWRFPSLTINAMQASSRKQAGNIINDAAWARVSIRLAKGMVAQRVADQLKKHLEAAVPWGLELKLTMDACADPWSIEPVGIAFDAASAAMRKGYGKEPLKIGCGGSIPFVKPFASALGGVPAILVGVEDPYTNAHGENESLLISDLCKACLSEIHFFTILAEMWPRS